MNEIKNIFKDNITYVEYARSGVVYFTEDLEKAKILKEKGWKYSKCCKGIRIIPPEETIVDITDYKKVLQYQNLVFNLAYYDFIKNLIENNMLKGYINSILERKKFLYKDFEYLISYGPILDTEVRVSGSDTRVSNLKMDMVESFIKSEEYKFYYENAKNELGKTKNIKTHIRKFRELSDVQKNFYKEVKENINIIKEMEPYNQVIFEYNNLEILDEIQADILLFVPFGCFKYMSSFINDSNLNKVMFWEIHAENSKESTFKLFSKEIYGKKVLIIDNMYSGKTMKILKNKVIEMGGMPILFGLSPRNKNNILNADYVSIINTIYKTSDINIEEEDFFRNKYVEICKGGDTNEY
ncbi:MAG: hypothetical protein E7311_02700 [Clostridiales bacterium]|nr:hypothetical protein [Clostridiales bacterium]